MQKQILSIKTIFNSMISTLLLLTMLMGFIIVEKNTRKIGFADNDPWFFYKDSNEEGHYMKIRFMNKYYVMDFSCLYDLTNVISQNVIQWIDMSKNIAKNI